MRLIPYTTREQLFAGVAQAVLSDLRASLSDTAGATLAVPGGTTPGPVFDLLAEADLPWERVSVMLTDERWVPGDHARSNTRLLYSRLMIGQVLQAHYVPLYLPGAAPEDRLAEIQDEVARACPISVLLLGMGEDMHTASLFPGADLLDQALSPDAPPVLPMRAPGAGEPRLTLTAPVLQGAHSTHLLITGPAKRAALETALTLDSTAAPVATILANATVHWAE